MSNYKNGSIFSQPLAQSQEDPFLDDAITGNGTIVRPKQPPTDRVHADTRGNYKNSPSVTGGWSALKSDLLDMINAPPAQQEELCNSFESAWDAGSLPVIYYSDALISKMIGFLKHCQECTTKALLGNVEGWAQVPEVILMNPQYGADAAEQGHFLSYYNPGQYSSTSGAAGARRKVRATVARELATLTGIKPEPRAQRGVFKQRAQKATSEPYTHAGATFRNSHDARLAVQRGIAVLSKAASSRAQLPGAGGAPRGVGQAGGFQGDESTFPDELVPQQPRSHYPYRPAGSGLSSIAPKRFFSSPTGVSPSIGTGFSALSSSLEPGAGTPRFFNRTSALNQYGGGANSLRAASARALAAADDLERAMSAAHHE